MMKLVKYCTATIDDQGRAWLQSDTRGEEGVRGVRLYSNTPSSLKLQTAALIGEHLNSMNLILIRSNMNLNLNSLTVELSDKSPR